MRSELLTCDGHAKEHKVSALKHLNHTTTLSTTSSRSGGTNHLLLSRLDRLSYVFYRKSICKHASKSSVGWAINKGGEWGPIEHTGSSNATINMSTQARQCNNQYEHTGSFKQKGKLKTKKH